LHPRRRALDRAGVDIERAADAHHERDAELAIAPVHEVLLRRRAEPEEHDIGRRGADLGDHVIFVGKVAVTSAGDAQRREPRARDRSDLGNDRRPSA